MMSRSQIASPSAAATHFRSTVRRTLHTAFQSARVMTKTSRTTETRMRTILDMRGSGCELPPPCSRGLGAVETLAHQVQDSRAAFARKPAQELVAQTADVKWGVAAPIERPAGDEPPMTRLEAERGGDPHRRFVALIH